MAIEESMRVSARRKEDGTTVDVKNVPDAREKKDVTLPLPSLAKVPRGPVDGPTGAVAAGEKAGTMKIVGEKDVSVALSFYERLFNFGLRQPSRRQRQLGKRTLKVGQKYT